MDIPQYVKGIQQYVKGIQQYVKGTAMAVLRDPSGSWVYSQNTGLQKTVDVDNPKCLWEVSSHLSEMVFEQKSLSKDLVLCTQLNIPETVLLTLHLKRKKEKVRTETDTQQGKNWDITQAVSLTLSLPRLLHRLSENDQ